MAVAQSVGSDLLTHFNEWTTRIKIAGSVRRKKPEVGDLELLIIPMLGIRPGGNLFNRSETYSLTDERIELLVQDGWLEFRETKAGNTVNGPKIKLLRDPDTGIPVDIFITNEKSWHNYLVCRTGPKESNLAIAKRAREMGLKWEPYSSGFRDLSSKSRIVCNSEREVFDTVELPYTNPDGI